MLLVTHNTHGRSHSRDRHWHTHTDDYTESPSNALASYAFESIVNYSIAIPFYKFSHVFFFCSLRFILFRRAHTHTHTHSTAGRRCCFSRLVMASITSHRIDENDTWNDSPKRCIRSSAKSKFKFRHSSYYINNQQFSRECHEKLLNLCRTARQNHINKIPKLIH